MQKLKTISIIAYIFLFIFMPLVLLPFNVLHILVLWAFLFLLSSYKKEFISLLLSKDIAIFLGLNFFIAIYTFLLSTFSSRDYTTTFYAILTILEVVPCAIFIAIVLIKNRVSLYKFYDIVLLVGLLQVCWVIICLLSPTVRDWIISSSGSQGLEDVYSDVMDFRLFGLARGYTFSMPLFQGLCVIISLVLAKYKSRKYYFLVPFFVISILLNGRIGLISLLVAPLVIFIFRLNKHFFREISAVALLILIAFFSVQQIKSIADGNSEMALWATWVSKGADEVMNYIATGEESGNIAVASSMWFAPKGVELIFGTGENVFGRINNGSDLGYVVNLYYGGIIFSIILYFAYLLFIIQATGKDVVERIMLVSLAVFLLFANFKGNVFRPNEIINGSVLLVVFSTALRKSEYMIQASTSKNILSI